MTRYRWIVLALGITAQAAFAALLQGLPAIGPALRSEYGLSLSAFGAMLGAVTLGATLTLIPWGLFADRLGERRAISIGLAGTAVAMGLSGGGGRALLAAMLLLAGMLGAVANVASGRAVMGWFEFSQRGTAFGLRQAGVPLGGAAAAVALPALVSETDARTGLLTLGAACLAAAVACAAWLRDPPGSTSADTGARGPLRDRRIYRLAAASGLLVTAQVSVIGFVVLFLNEERGLSPVAAGVVLGVIQVLGIVARVMAGRRSDRTGRRLAPLRQMAVAITAAWVVTPALLGAPIEVLVPVLVAASALTFSWNGLSFTAAAEYAPPGRSGTAIALQQTALFGAASLASPAFGALVSATGWRIAFWAVALGPALAWWLLRPLSQTERWDRRAADAR